MATSIPHKAFDATSFFEQLKLGRTSSPYGKTEVIMSQGEPSDSLFYVQSGSVKLTIVSKNGKEAIISVADGGTFFGESCILPGRPVRIQSAVALTNVRLVRIEAALVKRVIRSGGETALDLVSVLLKRNTEIIEDLATRLVESSEESLARVVSSLVRYKSKFGRELPPKISQQTLGEMIGISRQHVNVLMKRLAAEGAAKSDKPDISRPSPPRNNHGRERSQS